MEFQIIIKGIRNIWITFQHLALLTLIGLCSNSCMLKYFPTALDCNENLKVSEVQFMKAFDKFFYLYPENIIPFDSIQRYAEKDSSFFRKYHKFKISARRDSLYKINLMKAYFKTNLIPPGIGSPSYSFFLKSADNNMRFSLRVMGCKGITDNSYNTQEPKVCVLCLTHASFKKEGTNKFQYIDFSRKTKRERKLAVSTFQSDLIPKIEKILISENKLEIKN